MATTPEGADAEYRVSNPEENPHKSEVFQKHIRFLEKGARKALRPEPKRRGRFPVNRAAGAILLIAGLVLVVRAFTSEGGIMSMFVNSFLPGGALILLGVLCLAFREK